MLLKFKICVNCHAKVSYIFTTLQWTISSTQVREGISVSKFGGNVDHFGFSFIKAKSIVMGPLLQYNNFFWGGGPKLEPPLSHIHGSQHRSFRILLCGVLARNTAVTVFFLRCTFFKGAFHSFTDRNTDHPRSSLGDHPCYLRHHRVYTGQASGVILGALAHPWKKS